MATNDGPSMFSRAFGVSDRPSARPWLRLVLIALSAIMLSFAAFGVLSKGKPGRLTWGPSVDIIAASIALNEMYSGKMNGLGRLENARAIAVNVTETGDWLAIGSNSELVEDTKRVDAGLKAASKIYTPKLPPAVMESHLWLTTLAEDIGYTDFYYDAFRIFGVGALSTHYLFLSLLISSAMLFAGGMRRSTPALACLTLTTTAFFVLTTANIFSPSTPAIASNRFLATLIVIPMLHILLLALRRDRFHVDELIFFVLQALLFAFVVTLRSSANWAIVGMIAIGIAMLFARTAGMLLNARRPERVEAQIGLDPSDAAGAPWHSGLTRFRALPQLGIILLVPIILATAWGGLRTAALDPIYRSGDVLPHHLRWHSAFLGLSEHPRWQQNLPIPELAGIYGDGLGWTMYAVKMTEERPNEPQTSAVTGGHRYGVVEQILERETLKFIKTHPVYALELYGFYKPKTAVETIAAVLSGVPLLAWLLALPSFAAATAGLMRMRQHRAELVVALVLATGASFAPVIWAYPKAHVISDQTYTTLFIGLMIVALATGLGARFFSARFQMDRKREHPAQATESGAEQ